ncbi:DUF58 domain-containing protein [candidate division WOR-3 bacterium]|nr:DUF58 domain-containing protein [candidate division WOR-3 bacterium]
MQAPTKYLDPEVVARLTGLELKARLVVEGFISGLHTSPYKGFSQEFADYRQYMPGDEPKRLDWKVYGRTDRFYIKEYQDETNLRAYILLDKSGSMGYGPRMSKLEYAKYLCASLAYLFHRQRDSVGIATFDTRIQNFIPPSAKRTNFMHILTAIDHAQPGGETAVSSVLLELAQKLRRRGLVVVVSDLLDEHRAVLRALRSFRYRKHELLVLHILDQNESTFPFEKQALFVDMETQNEMTIQPDLVRASYRKKFQLLLDSYRHTLLSARIGYELMYTNTPYDRALLAYVHKRGMLL